MSDTFRTVLAARRERSRPMVGERLGVPLALLALYFIWGSTYLAIRFAVETFPPFFAASIRFLAAGLILMIVLKLRGAPWPSRREWRGAAIVGILLLALGN